jgi:hypothetical protein
MDNAIGGPATRGYLKRLHHARKSARQQQRTKAAKGDSALEISGLVLATHREVYMCEYGTVPTPPATFAAALADLHTVYGSDVPVATVKAASPAESPVKVRPVLASSGSDESADACSDANKDVLSGSPQKAAAEAAAENVQVSADQQIAEQMAQDERRRSSRFAVPAQAPTQSSPWMPKRDPIAKPSPKACPQCVRNNRERADAEDRADTAQRCAHAAAQRELNATAEKDALHRRAKASQANLVDRFVNERENLKQRISALKALLAEQEKRAANAAVHGAARRAILQAQLCTAHADADKQAQKLLADALSAKSELEAARAAAAKATQAAQHHKQLRIDAEQEAKQLSVQAKLSQRSAAAAQAKMQELEQHIMSARAARAARKAAAEDEVAGALYARRTFSLCAPPCSDAINAGANVFMHYR